jgi:hypothetical protein
MRTAQLRKTPVVLLTILTTTALLILFLSLLIGTQSILTLLTMLTISIILLLFSIHIYRVEANLLL